MEKKDVVDFLKKEENIEWLEKLNKFIHSHIEILKSMSELESHLKEKEPDDITPDSKDYNNSDNPMTKEEYENYCKNKDGCRGIFINLL